MDFNPKLFAFWLSILLIIRYYGLRKKRADLGSTLFHSKSDYDYTNL